MGKPQGRKKGRAKDKGHRRIVKAKNQTRYADQVYADLQPHNAHRLQNAAPDEELPGLGQHYCASCAKHFTGAAGLADHARTKDHKRRLKALQEKPYDLEMAALVNKY